MKRRPICSSLISTPALHLAALVLAATSAHAATFTWGGGTGNWNSVNWLPGPVAGTVNPADSAIVTGGLVNFAQHDTFGNAGTTTSPLITIDNTGTLASNGWFTTIIGLNFTGGTLHANGGANVNFQAFNLKGTVTSSGTSAITSTGAAFSGVHVNNNTFDVSSGTLTVSASLQNAAGGGVAGFTKAGAGTMTLSGVNGLTGSVVSSAGTLNLASGGSLTNISVLNSKSGGAVTISGTVTIGNAGSFGVGAGAAGTTGSVTVNTGGILNVGNGGGFVGIGGKDASGSGLGNGTLTIAGGTMNVAAPGTGTSAATGLSGQAGGLDATSFWMNPYGTGGGTSTINLDGGTLATARVIARGSTSNAIFNFNGGTLQTTAATAGAILNGMTRANIRNGGGTIDTVANNLTLAQPLLHSDIGGDNAIDGGFTKLGAGNLTLNTSASTFTGNVTVSAGTLTLTGSSNTATPTATSLGNMTTAGKTVTIASGASLVFGNNDTIGSTTIANTGASFIVNGGTLSHGTFFTSIGNITLNSGATMTGGNGVVAGFQTWTLRGSVTVGGTSGSTINTTGTTNTGIHLGVNGNNEFIVNSTGSAVDLTVNAPLIDRPGNNVGAGVLRKTGAGTMLLGSANAYTGATILDGGTLLVNGSTTAASAVSVTAGATLGGTGTVGGTATVASGGTIQAGQNGSGMLTLGGLTLAGNATLAFGSASNYVSNPGINVTSSNALVANGAANSVLFTFSGGLTTGTYKLVGYSGTLGGTGQSAFSLGVLPGRAAGALDFGTAGLIQLNVTGIDSLVWTGTNNSTWSTASQAPTFNWKLNSNSAGTDFLANDIVVFDDTATNKTVSISGGNVAPASVAFTNTSGNDYTLGGANGISGGAAITKSGSGKVTFNNANTHTGGTTISAGTIAFGNTAALGTGAVTVNGGALDVNGISPTIGALSGSGGVVTNSVAGSATLNVNSAASSTFAGAFQDGAGTLALNKQGNGTLILTGTSTHTGGTTISTGTLQLGDGTASGSVAGTVTTNATLAFNPGSAQSFGATINGTGNITKLGTNTLTLTAAATHTGLTTASNGTLVIANGASISGSSSVSAAGGILTVDAGGTISNVPSVNTKGGGTLNVSGTVTVANGGSFGIGAGATATTGTVVVNTGGVLNIGNGGGFAGIGGRDSTGAGLGNGTLTVAGGTVNVAAPGNGTSGLGLDAFNFWMNPYGTGGGTSTVNLDGGALNLSRPIANGSGSSTIFNFNGGTLQAATTGAGVLLNGLTRANVRNGGARIDTGANNITLNQALLHSNIGGDNAIDGGFTKLGSGTLTVTGAGTYTGNATVSGGTITNNVGANNASPTATGLGDMTIVGKTVSVAAGAKIVFNASDAMGAFQYKTPVVFNVNGGTLENGAARFMSIGDITLSNGGRINTVNGADPGFQVFNLRGDITVNGASGSFISTSGTTNNGIHLGGTTTSATTFNVAATGDPAADLTVSAPLLNEVFNVGSLTKTGSGKMVLTAANAYTGVTNVNGGTLIVDGSLPSTNVVNVANGAGFGRSVGSSTSIGALSLGASALYLPVNGTLTVNNADALVATGGASSVTINVSGAAPVAGVYTLLDYTGTLGGGFSAFTLGTLPLRTSASLVDNAGNTSIELNVTGVDSARWSGALGSSWTVATQAAPKNWVLNSNGSTPTDYLPGDNVHFTDTASSGTVTIDDADVAPAAVNVNNSTLAYSFGGTRAITGGTSLTKSGTAALALNSANTYSGPTNLNGGTTTVVNGALGTGSIVFGGGTLAYATGNTQDLSARFANSASAIAIDTNGNNVTFAAPVAGSNTGGLTKSGIGTLTLASNASTFTGDVNVTAGTVAITAGLLNPTPVATALGNPTVARTVTIGSGARLELKQHDILGNDGANPALTFVVNGGTLAAVSGSQASGNGPFNILPAVTLNGGTISATNGAFAPVQSLSLKGDITVTGSTPSFINTTGTTALLDGVHLSKAGGVTFNVADVTGSNAADLTVSTRLLNTANSLVANGLTKSGNGTMVLSAVNDYTGATSVAAGTLLITGSVSGSDVSVESGATIGGTTTAKTLWVKSGGIFSPGTSIGTFTTSGGDILLEGISNFEINKTGLSLSADLAVSNTAIVFGGTLNVTSTGDALVEGNTFNLFDAPDLGANIFSTINLPSLDPGLYWDTADLTNGGTITVIPEPGSATLLLAGLAMLARRRRK